MCFAICIYSSNVTLHFQKSMFFIISKCILIFKYYLFVTARIPHYHLLLDSQSLLLGKCLSLLLLHNEIFMSAKCISIGSMVSKDIFFSFLFLLCVWVMHSDCSAVVVVDRTRSEHIFESGWVQLRMNWIGYPWHFSCLRLIFLPQGR